MNNIQNVQNQDFRSTVTEYLKHVMPQGDGIYGSKTLPFTGFIQTLYDPVQFTNMCDYALRVVSDIGKPVQAKPYAKNINANLNQAHYTVLDDLAGTILNHTLPEDTSSMIRNMTRVGYVSSFPADPAGFLHEGDISTINPNNDPNVVLSLLAKMGPIGLSLQEKDRLSENLGMNLLNMLSILRNSGDINAYKLALKLCNLSESYFALANTVNNLATAAMNINPATVANPTNIMTPDRMIQVGAVDAINVPQGVDNTRLSVGDLVNRYAYDISALINAAPNLGHIITPLMNFGGNLLPEAVLNNVHALISEGAMINPMAFYSKVVADENLTKAASFATTSTMLPYKLAVPIVYIMLSINADDMVKYQMINSLGVTNINTLNTIQAGMAFDIQHGTIINTVLSSVNPANGNLGKIIRHYAETSLAQGKPVRLVDVLNFTKTHGGNVGTAININDIKMYLQALEPQFYAVINQESLMQFAEILYNLNY